MLQKACKDKDLNENYLLFISACLKPAPAAAWIQAASAVVCGKKI